MGCPRLFKRVKRRQIALKNLEMTRGHIIILSKFFKYQIPKINNSGIWLFYAVKSKNRT